MAFSSSIRCRKATFDGSRTYVMGVVNATPDSFSDGGTYDPVAQGLALSAEGADLIDVGGESTRPGSEGVDARTEVARVLPVIEALASLPVPISIDTSKAEVARAALAAGAELVNDVTGGMADPELLSVCAQAGVPLVLGHLRGTPRTMQVNIVYTDVFEEVAAELARSIEIARAAGVTQIVADPGIGFGKSVEHNLTLLARAGELSARLSVPVMVGPSRKSFLKALVDLPVDKRLFPTLGASVAAAVRGADFVRVHDVAAHRQALAVADRVRAAS